MHTPSILRLSVWAFLYFDYGIVVVFLAANSTLNYRVVDRLNESEALSRCPPLGSPAMVIGRRSG